MHKQTAILFCSLFIIISAQRPSSGRLASSEGPDMGKCLHGLETLRPFLITLVEEVYMEDPNSYIQDLKILYNHFRSVAADCGINLPGGYNKGNPSQCKKDINTLNGLFRELRNQAKKSTGEQNLISLITIYMSLANNVPKAIQDCGFRRI